MVGAFCQDDSTENNAAMNLAIENAHSRRFHHNADDLRWTQLLIRRSQFFRGFEHAPNPRGSLVLNDRVAARLLESQQAAGSIVAHASQQNSQR